MNKIYILYDYEDGITLLKAFFFREDAEMYKDTILSIHPNSLVHIKELEAI